MLVCSRVHLEICILESVVLNDREFVNVVSNGLRDGSINWLVLWWLWLSLSLVGLLCLLAHATEWWSERMAAWWFYLGPVWSSIGLPLAEAWGNWTEHWKLWWVVVEKTAAWSLRLNFTGFDFWLPESTFLASCDINWNCITHFKYLFGF